MAGVGGSRKRWAAPAALHALLLPLALLAACKRSDESGSEGQRAWTEKERPQDVTLLRRDGRKAGYVLKRDSLPVRGELAEAERPWTDSYWPVVQGGAAARWNVGDLAAHTRDQLRRYVSPGEAEFREMTLEQRARLSPTEKYDLYVGNGDYALTAHMRGRYEWRLAEIRAARVRAEEERLRASGLPQARVDEGIATAKEAASRLDVPEWEGMCHGWAAASLAFREPKPVVVRAFDRATGRYDGPGIPFGSSDIKALLTLYTGELYGNRGFIGRTCARDGKETKAVAAQAPAAAPAGLPLSGAAGAAGAAGTAGATGFAQGLSECERLNAGSFHVVLTNFIGLQKRGFVANMADDLSEMWNHPLYAYEVEFPDGKRRLPPSPKAARGTTPETTTDYELRVRTKVRYRTGAAPAWMQRGAGDSFAEKVFEYRLEIDAQTGNVLGGEWNSGNAPDYLWVQYAPPFDPASPPPGRSKELHAYLVHVKNVYDASLRAGVPRDFTAR